MSQGFVNSGNIPLPLPVLLGGTGGTTSTGSGAVVLAVAPSISQPNLIGTTTNNNAASGSVGEIIQNIILSASPVSMTNNVITDITSITLTAGDWDIFGNVTISGLGVTTPLYQSWSNTTSVTRPNSSLLSTVQTQTAATNFTWGSSVPYLRLSLSGSTIVYLTAYAAFTAGTVTAGGGLYARRVR
jgi:hypothetical protein